MSTIEYHDLYLKSQTQGKYHMFVFDIIDSKKMNNDYRYEAQIKMIFLMSNIYKTIQDIERKTGSKILVFEEDFVTFKSNFPPKGFGFKQEPFLIGDAFGFTIYKDSLSTNTIYNIYNYYKELLKIDFDFHLANGFYETNDYSKRNIEYFRGYCMDVLTKLHKKEQNKTLNKIKSKNS